MSVAVLSIAEVGRRDADVVQIGERHVARAQRHQPAGMRNSTGIQQHRVGHGEDRDVGADAQRQRQHRNQREAGRVPQLTKRITQFLQESVHGESSVSQLSAISRQLFALRNSLFARQSSKLSSRPRASARAEGPAVDSAVPTGLDDRCYACPGLTSWATIVSPCGLIQHRAQLFAARHQPHNARDSAPSLSFPLAKPPATSHCLLTPHAAPASAQSPPLSAPACTPPAAPPPTVRAAPPAASPDRSG